MAIEWTHGVPGLDDVAGVCVQWDSERQGDLGIRRSTNEHGRK